MDRVSAYAILNAELAEYRKLSYDELAVFRNNDQSRLTCDSNGVAYSVSTYVWQLHRGGAIAVSVQVAPAEWGGKHDSVEDWFVVTQKSAQT